MITKKLTNVFAGVVVALVAFSMMASTASAAFTAEQNAAMVAAGFNATQIAAMEAIFGGSSASSSTTSASSCATYGLPGVAGVQQAVNALGYMPALVVDGVSGPATKAGVMYAQAKVGAGVDGAWGPMTQVAYVAYVAANCTTTTTTTTETTTTTTGSLNGDAGSLDDADFVSSINNEEVGEGQSDVVVLAVDLEADHGSDLMVSVVRVEFEHDLDATGETGSDDFDDYADEVSVWFEGEMVGSIDVEDMNESSGAWSSNISLDSGAVIEAGEEAELSIAVSALNNIDSSDLGTANNDWSATLVNVRVMDAQGVTMTEGQGLGNLGDSREFFFDDALSANDVELTVSLSDNSPETMAVQIDEDGGEEVVLLVGEIEAEGEDVEITELIATITPGGTGDANDIASRYILVIDGEEVDSQDSDDCTTGTCNGAGAAAEYTFSDFEFTVEEGDTVDFEIVAELNEISGAFVNGDSLTADVDADDIEAEASDDLTSSELTGSANGEAQAFYASGISVEVVEADTEVTTVDAQPDTVQFTWVLDISAFDEDAYITSEVANILASGSNSATELNILYTDDSSVASQLEDFTEQIISSADMVTGDTGAYTGEYSGDVLYKIDAGSTERFTIIVSAENDAAGAEGVTNLVSAFLSGIEWTVDDVEDASGASDAIADTMNNYTFDMEDSTQTPVKTAR